MGDPTSFTDPENWAGGFYELSLELGDRDDDRLDRAVNALWVGAAIVGCYGSASREPADQVAVATNVKSLHEFGHLRGTVRLPDGNKVVCGCLATRLDDADADWLTFYLPIGALARTDRRVGGFPFGPDGGPNSLAWRAPLDEWLSALAGSIFTLVDFRLGLIGFEPDDGDTSAASLNGVIPEERWNGYLLPANYGLTYTPANR